VEEKKKEKLLWKIGRNALRFVWPQELTKLYANSFFFFFFSSYQRVSVFLEYEIWKETAKICKMFAMNKQGSILFQSKWPWVSVFECT
jgi:phage regulator Rha-like protein